MALRPFLSMTVAVTVDDSLANFSKFPLYNVILSSKK